SKLMYAIFLNRFQLSIKNNWVDDKGFVYLIYTIDELCKILGYGKNKVIKLKKELAKYNLLEEVRQGLNQPNLIYLQNVETDETILNSEFEDAKTGAEPLVSAEVSNLNFRKFKNQTSRSLKNKPQEVSNSNSNKTENNKIENNKTDFNIREEDEDREPNENPENIKTSQKIEKATKYDKDYIYQIVYDRFIADGIPQATVDYLAMGNFDQRYQYALENMRYAPNAEAVADYVFTGLSSDLQLAMRKVRG
ncbi:replication initiator protein A, partial [Streptococcus sobrinus]|uniref:replication initiator protein A n=1 Tax=Streptococcus sobrinus TaxID=1310 RepID=UPI0005B63205